MKSLRLRGLFSTDLLKSIILVLFFAYFFYRSLVSVIFLLPLGFFYYKNLQKRRQESERRKLTLQFKECLQSLAVNLRAGYSVENALIESIEDMRLLFGDRSLIVGQLQYIRKGMNNHINLETLLMNWGQQSKVRDIYEFGELFYIAKRSGGNMTEMISTTAEVLNEKMEAENQIQILLSEKKLEQKIMSAIPFIIVTYIGITSRGYFNVLYHNPIGVVIMTICMFIYIFATLIAEKLVNVKV